MQATARPCQRLDYHPEKEFVGLLGKPMALTED
jgi:hypothetical protein